MNTEQELDFLGDLKKALKDEASDAVEMFRMMVL